MDQSLIHVLRKKGESILTKITCSKCNIPLAEQKTYSEPPDLENQFPRNPTKRFCELCKNWYQNSKLQLSEDLIKVHKFFQVLCFKHPKIQAEYYFESTFQPACSKCKKRQDVRLCRIQYKTIENEFFLLYKKCEKIICKDRKKALVSYNTSDLLQACSWLKQIHSGPICKTHPFNFSICLDPDLNTYCSICENSVPFKFYFTEVQKVVEIILEAAKNKSRNSKHETLNTFMIKMVWISSRTFSRKDSEVNLMILETRDLLADKEYEVIRCVNCLKSISCGSKQGIPLECGHVFCFSCAFSPDYDKCPLDYIPAKYSEYLDGYQASMNECHALHYLGQMTAFKLPCFHYSCQEHLALESCLICGFEFRLWPSKPKESTRHKKLDEFLMVRCLAHNLKISCFKVFPAGFYCEKCSKVEDSVPICGNLNMVFNLFDSLYSVALERMLNKDFQITNLNFWKIETFLKVACNQKKFVFLGIIETYFNYCRLHPTKQILFFNELLPSIRSTTKYLKIPSKSEIKIKIIPNQELIISSLLIANQYFLIPEYSFPAIINFITIKRFSKNENLQDRKPMKLLVYFDESLEVNQKQYREFFLSNSVFISVNYWYEVSFEINPGEYFFGKPFSMTKNKEFSLEFENKKEVNELVGRFGGPFIGIGIFQLSSL